MPDIDLWIIGKCFTSQALETSLRAWEEKQRNTLSAVTQSTSTLSNTSQSRVQLQISSKPSQLSDEELNILFNFIEAVTTLVKWMKLLIISHPSLEPELYQVASRTAQALEQVHPDGKILQGVSEVLSHQRRTGNIYIFYERDSICFIFH